MAKNYPPPVGLPLGATYTTPEGVYIKMGVGRGVPAAKGVNLPTRGLDALATALMVPSHLSKYL